MSTKTFTITFDKKVAVVAICMLIASIVVVGIGYATNTNIIYGCVRSNGLLRVVADLDDCWRTETPISWNTVGPQGLEGPPGPQGEQGPQGEPGNLALAGESCPAGQVVSGFDENGDVICGSFNGVGVAKAGVWGRCASAGPLGPDSSIYRFFNNVNGSPVTIANGVETGWCTIDFGFDLSDRYLIVTAAHPDTPLGISVSAPPGPAGTSIQMYSWHALAGAPVEGADFFLIVY